MKRIIIVSISIILGIFPSFAQSMKDMFVDESREERVEKTIQAFSKRMAELHPETVLFYGHVFHKHRDEAYYGINMTYEEYYSFMRKLVDDLKPTMKEDIENYISSMEYVRNFNVDDIDDPEIAKKKIEFAYHLSKSNAISVEIGNITISYNQYLRLLTVRKERI